MLKLISFVARITGAKPHTEGIDRVYYLGKLIAWKSKWYCNSFWSQLQMVLAFLIWLDKKGIPYDIRDVRVLPGVGDSREGCITIIVGMKETIETHPDQFQIVPVENNPFVKEHIIYKEEVYKTDSLLN